VSGCVTAVQRERPAKRGFRIGQFPFVEGPKERARGMCVGEIRINRKRVFDAATHAGKRFFWRYVAEYPSGP
jgi:hypothetical protein